MKQNLLAGLIVLVGSIVMILVFKNFNEKFRGKNFDRDEVKSLYILNDSINDKSYIAESSKTKIININKYTSEVKIVDREDYFRLTTRSKDYVFIPINEIKDFGFVHAYKVTYLYFRTRLPFVEWVRVYSDEKFKGVFLKLSLMDFPNREIWQVDGNGMISILSTYKKGSFYKTYSSMEIDEDITTPKPVYFLNSISPFKSKWLVTSSKLKTIFPLPFDFSKEVTKKLKHNLKVNKKGASYYDSVFKDSFKKYKDEVVLLLNEHCTKLSIQKCDDLLKRKHALSYLDLSFI